MTPSNPQVYRCSRCGQIRPMEELNGLVLVDGRWSDQDAYYRKLVDCKSPEAYELLDYLINELNANHDAEADAGWASEVRP